MEKLLQIVTHLGEPEFISHNIEYLVIIIILNSFLEVIFPPVPGDAILILGGSLSGYAGINPFWVVAGAFAGTFSASLLLYKFGLGMERKMLHSHRFSALLDTKTFYKLEKTLNRYGLLLIVLSRFIPVIRSGIIIAAGIVNLDQRKSMLALSISILASTSLYVLGGRFLGKKLQSNIGFWSSRLTELLIGALLVFTLCLAVSKIIKWIKKKNKPQSDAE